MAIIEQRTSQDGKSVYRVKVRRKGAPPLTATFPRLTDAKRGTLTFHQTKNGEHRAVPLTGQALTLMQQHAKMRRLNTQLVFPDATGTRPLRTRDCT